MCTEMVYRSIPSVICLFLLQMWFTGCDREEISKPFHGTEGSCDPLPARQPRVSSTLPTKCVCTVLEVFSLFQYHISRVFLLVSR